MPGHAGVRVSMPQAPCQQHHLQLVLQVSVAAVTTQRAVVLGGGMWPSTKLLFRAAGAHGRHGGTEKDAYALESRAQHCPLPGRAWATAMHAHGGSAGCIAPERCSSSCGVPWPCFFVAEQPTTSPATQLSSSSTSSAAQGVTAMPLLVLCSADLSCALGAPMYVMLLMILCCLSIT
jgi:hypothetical protein